MFTTRFPEVHLRVDHAREYRQACRIEFGGALPGWDRSQLGDFSTAHTYITRQQPGGQHDLATANHEIVHKENSLTGYLISLGGSARLDCFAGAKLVVQPFGDQGRDEVIDLAVKRANLFDEAGRDELVSVACH